MSEQASWWFKDEAEFRQLCGDAQSQATSERSQEFAHDMMEKANKYGLQTYITERQLKWLCELADWSVPEKIA